MTYLFNVLPYVIVITFGLIIRYAVPSKVGKILFGVIGVLFLIVYFQIQPSYLPKGGVKPEPALPEFQVKQGEMVDKQPKSMSREDRVKIISDDLEKTDLRLKQMIKELKSEKGE